MSTVTQVQLVAPVAMTGSDARYYVAPALTSAKIGRAVFTNTDTSAHTLTVNITTNGTSAAGNTLISARSLAPGESYVSPELAGQVIPAGSDLRGLAATTITIAVSGITIV